MTFQNENSGPAGSSPNGGKRRTRFTAATIPGNFLNPGNAGMFLTAATGGIIGCLAWEPVNAWFLTPVSVWIFFKLVQNAKSATNAAGRGLVFGWFLFYGSLFWLNSLHKFHSLAPLGVVLLALYGGLYPSLTGFLAHKLSNSNSRVSNWIIFISIWLLTEWVRTLGRLAFPLVQLGHSWTHRPDLIQHASLLGELGISLQILLIAWLLECCVSFLRGARERIRELATTAIVCVAVIASSVIQYLAVSGREALESPDNQFRIVLFQPNINQMTKLISYSFHDPQLDELKSARVRRDYTQQITKHQEDMILASNGKAYDLALLPETSFTQLDFFHNLPLRERIGAMARHLGSPMIVGGSRDIGTKNRSEMYNSLYLVHEDGVFDKEVYDKMRLVPFGEHIPYFDLIPGVSQLVAIGSFHEGRKQVVFEKDGMRFGGLICFESTFSSLGRGLVRSGAGLIVVITNDAWYGLTAGAAHHHNLSILRAIENRRHVARCANTGISSIIAPSGKITATLSLGKQGIVEGMVSISPTESVTLFTHIGNTWMIIPALLIMSTVIRKGRRT